MARYIDADALFPYGAVPFITDNGFATAEKVKEIIAKAPSVFEWISVKDKLPDETKDEYVLVVCDYYGKIKVETRKMWHIDSVVTHWMPLPEPPEMKETKDSLLFADMEEIIDATD